MAAGGGAVTTLCRDCSALADAEVLGRILWPLCEKVSERLKQSSVAARAITLKLKTADLRVRTRSRRVADATQLADTLYLTAARLLAAETDGVTRFRLIGVGADALVDSHAADPLRRATAARTGDRPNPRQAR
jgi:DNA polymerase-4